MTEKILHITWDMGVGGKEKALIQLIKGQRQAGREADLLVSSQINAYEDELKKTHTRVYALGQRSGSDFFVRKKFLEIIKDYSLLHFHGPDHVLLPIVSRKRSHKLFYTHRSGLHPYPLSRKVKYKIAGHFIRKYFNGISANSRHAALVASRLFHLPIKKIIITYNGVDFSLLIPSRSKEEILKELGEKETDVIRIGTSANLRKWKRIDYLLKAAFALKGLPIRCYIIGDGPSRAWLEKLSQELGVSEIVTFTGRKFHVENYLQLLDIFILPSGQEESFGNSAVEAMSLGIPTIVMGDGGGLMEHISEGMGLIARTPEDIPGIIRKLAESENLRKSMGEKCKEFVRKKYTIKKMIEAYERLYLQ
ncbi:MAG: glycosyltransferase [Candidatus Aminicenantales bacterium]